MNTTIKNKKQKTLIVLFIELGYVSDSKTFDYWKKYDHILENLFFNVMYFTVMNYIILIRILS